MYVCAWGGEAGFPGICLDSPPSLPNQQGFCSFKNGSPFLSLLGPRHWILADTQRKKPQSASPWAGVTPISTTGENPDDPGDRAQPSADRPRPDAPAPLGGVSPTVPAEQETVSAVPVSVTLWGGAGNGPVGANTPAREPHTAGLVEGRGGSHMTAGTQNISPRSPSPPPPCAP